MKVSRLLSEAGWVADVRAVSRNHFVNRREREKELVFGQAWKVTKANLSYAKGASDVLWQMDVDVWFWH